MPIPDVPLSCCCDWGTGRIGAVEGDGDTPWCGDFSDKLYLQSGQFTSTISTSQSVGAVDTSVLGISWDGTNTPWCGNVDDKLYLQSGQFTSTLKTSESISAIDNIILGISWDGTNTPWCGRGGALEDDKLYLQSGQFTSTLKTSENINSIVGPQGPGDISWDGINTPWCGQSAAGGANPEKLYLQSGQFTSTLKTSLGTAIGGSSGTDISGISWDGTDTPWTHAQIFGSGNKLYLQSGQFTSTIKTSQDVTTEDVASGINTNKLTIG